MWPTYHVLNNKTFVVLLADFDIYHMHHDGSQETSDMPKVVAILPTIIEKRSEE